MPQQKRSRTTKATPGRVRAPYSTYAPPPRANPRRQTTSAPSWLGWLRPPKRSSTPPANSPPSTTARPHAPSRATAGGDGHIGRDLRAGAHRARAFIARGGQRRPTVSHDLAHPAATSRPRRPHPTDDRRRLRIHPALVALILAQIALIAVAIWGLTSPTWQVRHIRVEGTRDPALLSAIQSMPLTGCNIFRCDLAASAHQVGRLPLVAHAEAQASYPDTIVIVVTPRHPAVLWHTAAGDVVLASDGTVLGAPESDPTFTNPSLPQIDDDAAVLFSGQMPQAGQSISAVLVEMAGQLRKDMGATLGDGWSLRYTADRGFVAASATSQQQVLFGAPSDAALATQASAQAQALPQVAPPSADAVAHGVQQQLAELHALLALLRQRGEHATLIDLRWGSHPYYRLDG